MGLLCVTVVSRLPTSQGALQFQDFATTLPKGKQRKIVRFNIFTIDRC
jgi:hypothetical protein